MSRAGGRGQRPGPLGQLAVTDGGSASGIPASPEAASARRGLADGAGGSERTSGFDLGISHPAGQNRQRVGGVGDGCFAGVGQPHGDLLGVAHQEGMSEGPGP